MKVLLLFKTNPKTINIQQNILPNGLMYIAALLLKNKVDTEVLNLSGKSWDECGEIIKDKCPDIVGIGCYTFNRHACIRLAGIAKGADSRIKVILGGPHPSVMHTQILENFRDIDIIALNEGEITLLEITQRLSSDEQFEGLKGIVYRVGSKIINNGLRDQLENLDWLPIPAEYFRYKRIITSRGCPGRCIFCNTPMLWGQNVRFRSAENVVDEIEILNKRWGVSSFIISDDTFTLDRDRTIRICKEIIRRGLKITWDCRSRANLVCEERLRWMKKAGCISISYGIESGSQKILNNLKKGIKVEQIRKAAALTRRFCLNLNYFIIVGSPGETDETIRETMRLIEDTKPTSIFTYVMQLMPGTKIYSMAKQDKLIDDADWITKDDETIFYTKEKKIHELNRYARLIDELFRIRKGEFQYNEDEIKECMKDVRGVQDLINLAHIKIGANKPDEAEGIIDEALELNSGAAEALMDKAVILAMKDDPGCIDLFNRAIKSDPEMMATYKNLGLFLFKHRRYEEAIKIYEKAIGIEPADIGLYDNLGSVYGTKKEYDKAIRTFERALLINPRNIGTLRNLAITFENKGDQRMATNIRQTINRLKGA